MLTNFQGGNKDGRASKEDRIRYGIRAGVQTAVYECNNHKPLRSIASCNCNHLCIP